MNKVAPYGSWRSSLSGDALSGGNRLYDLQLDGQDVYWCEGRSSEKGRSVLVRLSQGKIEDVLAEPWSVRTRVHEYGGLAYAVEKEWVVFSNHGDARMYSLSPASKTPIPITAEDPSTSYADQCLDLKRKRVITVQEKKTKTATINTLVGVAISGNKKIDTLVSGDDFFSNPKISPDGKRLTWLSWNLPNMPWDGNSLWIADINLDGSLSNTRQVAGGPKESIFQPEWSKEGILYFSSDKTDWANLYFWNGEQVVAVAPTDAEIMQPQWFFGQSSYALMGQNAFCNIVEQGVSKFAKISLFDGDVKFLKGNYLPEQYIKANDEAVYFIGGSSSRFEAVIRYDPFTKTETIVTGNGKENLESNIVSLPEPFTFSTSEKGISHAFFYPPTNPGFVGPANELPPLIVTCHGGPTGNARRIMQLTIQYWTSRGFAVVDVDYRGSTGYGRKYREQLYGNWGVYDMDDCVNAAKDLVRRGKVDPKSITIRGSSAGGYTALCALTFSNFFKAGASYYGIGDLEAIREENPKFESGSFERLIGPYPQEKERYKQRSPINFPEKLSCPIILFQGLEDKVVPPSQSENMQKALLGKNLPVAYLTFAEEGHGFRNPENVKRSLEAELFFYSKVFGFELSEEIEPVNIRNLNPKKVSPIEL